MKQQQWREQQEKNKLLAAPVRPKTAPSAVSSDKSSEKTKKDSSAKAKKDVASKKVEAGENLEGAPVTKKMQKLLKLHKMKNAKAKVVAKPASTPVETKPAPAVKNTATKSKKPTKKKKKLSEADAKKAEEMASLLSACIYKRR